MQPRRTLIVLALFAVALLGYNIGAYDLWAPDEPRFAQVAREMLRSGDWITPHVNGEPYLEKPPVFFWAIAAVSAPFGDVSQISARIPSVAGAVITVLLTYALALRLFNDRIAWWSAIVLMTTSRFWWQARTAQIDMVLTAWLALTLYAFWLYVESPSRGWRFVFFGAVAAALLTKGPVGILFPLLLWVVYHWRRAEDRRRFPFIAGAAVSIVVALLWLVPARMAVASGGTGAALGQDFYRQVVGRALLGVSKAQPPWYYLIELPVDLMPWSLFVPWAIVWAWRNRGTDSVRLLAAWTLPAICVFSLFAGKRQIYLLPLFPAFAILIGASIVPLLDDARTRYRYVAAAIWVVVLIAAASLPAIVADRFSEWSIPHLYLYTIIAVPSVIAVLFECWRNRARRLPALIAIPIAALMTVTAYAALPKLNEAKSARAFCAPLKQLAVRDVEYRLYSFMFSREEYIFYADHFHQTVFVDSLPGHDDANLERVEDLLTSIGEGFFNAVNGVPIESTESISADEIRAVHDALETFHQSLIEADPDRAHSMDLVESASRRFTAEFTERQPAFMFIQTRDWPWLRALAPELEDTFVASAEHIGGREVLLIGNAAGRPIWPGE